MASYGSGGGAFAGVGAYATRSELTRSTTSPRWMTNVRTSLRSTRNGPNAWLPSFVPFVVPSVGSMNTYSPARMF